MKQKVITSSIVSVFKSELEQTISYGWLVKTVLAHDGIWLAILERDTL